MEVIKDPKPLAGGGGAGQPPKPPRTVNDADIPNDPMDYVTYIGRTQFFAAGIDHGRGGGPGDYYDFSYGAPQGGVRALQRDLSRAFDPKKSSKPLPQVPDYSGHDYKEGPRKPPTPAKKKV